MPFLSGCRLGDVPRARAGVLDLRGIDPGRACHLDGEWVFRPSTFELPSRSEAGPPYLDVPGPWNGKPLPSGLGYGTFALHVLLPRTHPSELALLLGEAYSADRLFVNGAVVFERGRLGRTAAEEIPDPPPGLARFPAPGESLDIAFEVSNHFHNEGGLVRTPVLGPPQALELRVLGQTKLDFFVLGCLGILTLYYGALFATRPELAHLLFGTLTLLSAVRLATTGWYLNDILPLGVSGQLRLDYVTVFASPPLYYAFVLALVPGGLSRLVLKAASAIGVVGILAALFLHTWVFTSLLDLAIVAGVAVTLLVFLSLLQAAARGGEGARILLLGAFLVLLFALHDSAERLGYIESPWKLLPLANLVLVTGHAAVLGLRFSRSLRTSERLRASLQDLNKGLEDRISERTAELEQVAGTDPLTGLHNRRSLTKLAEAERSAAIRQQHDISFLIVDIDRFKAVNDSWGHAAGDKVLQGVAAQLSSRLRGHDVVGRYGGDEFVVVLPYLGLEGARAAAERIRQEVAALRFPSPSGEPTRITLSLGVATAARDELLEAVLKRADGALYEAKSSGRNRVVVSRAER
jgi:diguanylate cyclase (GGDEF)-like protein